MILFLTAISPFWRWFIDSSIHCIGADCDCRDRRHLPDQLVPGEEGGEGGMVTAALVLILTGYLLGRAALECFYFRDKEEAFVEFRIWLWIIGSLLAAQLLTALNSYFLQE